MPDRTDAERRLWRGVRMRPSSFDEAPSPEDKPGYQSAHKSEHRVIQDRATDDSSYQGGEKHERARNPVATTAIGRSKPIR